MEFCSLRGRGRDQMHNFPSCSLQLLHPFLRRHRSISLGMFKIFLKALRGFCWSSIPLSWWLNSTWELLGNVGSGFFPFSIPRAHSWWISESPELQHKVLLFQKVVEPLFFSPPLIKFIASSVFAWHCGRGSFPLPGSFCSVESFRPKKKPKKP